MERGIDLGGGIAQYGQLTRSYIECDGARGEWREALRVIKLFS